MKYCALASGSNGNCYYVANNEEAILIDVGINSKHVHLRMQNLGIDPTTIKAIFITHEHSDHIRGLSVFAKKYWIPIYITKGSYRGSKLHLPCELVHLINPDERIAIGALSITGVPKYHDAKEPCSFVVSDGKYTIGILTDIGRACENVKHVIQQSDVLLLESNFDRDMLETGRYSFYLKNRIRSGRGHLSNEDAVQLFLENKSPRLRHLILGHLSGQNNTVEIVNDSFAPHCAGIQLSIATRYCETEIFNIEDDHNHRQAMQTCNLD